MSTAKSLREWGDKKRRYQEKRSQKLKEEKKISRS